jgi:hypothetical protein
MWTLFLQVLNSLGVLLIGWCALRVARAGSTGHPSHRAAWVLLAQAFLPAGMFLILQDAWGTAAFLSGAGTPLWDHYLRWLPAMNHSRGALVAMFAALLVALALRPSSAPRWVGSRSAVLLVCAFLVGSVAGFVLGGYERAFHLTTLATTSLGILLLLTVASGLHLARDSVDRILWIVITLYTVHMAISVVSITPLAASVDGWYVPPWIPPFFDLIFTILMLGASAWALRQRRRGIEIPALLDRFRPPQDLSMALPRNSSR